MQFWCTHHTSRPPSYISVRPWYILFPLQKYNGQLPCQEIQLKVHENTIKIQLENSTGRHTPKLGCTKIYVTKYNNALITRSSNTFENKVRCQNFLSFWIKYFFGWINFKSNYDKIYCVCHMLGHRVHCCGQTMVTFLYNQVSQVSFFSPNLFNSI